MVNVTKIRYVECLYPGSFFSEEHHISWEQFEAEGVPKKCFAYQIFEVETKSATVDGEQFSKSQHTAIGGKVYPGGEVFTIAELEAKFGGTATHRILIDNMRSNDWRRVVCTRLGNWQPFEEGDKIE